MTIRRICSRSTLERRATLSRISNSAHRMDRMVRSLVDYARKYFGGRIPIQVAPENMGGVCQRVVDEVKATHPGAPIRFNVAGNVEGEWDADRVAQAITNLVVNALEHATGEVAIDVAGGADDVTVTVSNEGGFPDALRAKGDARSRGLGLGLFIVREVVEAHGGRVALVDTSGPVTRFTTYWPRRALSRSLA